jgi:transcriptional regulator with XRE-family HTH domain
MDDTTPSSGQPEAALGKRVKELRKACGWSQEELARRMSALGFSWVQTTAAKTELANRPIRVNEAVALARLLGLTFERLLYPGGPAEERAHALTYRRSLLEHDVTRAATRVKQLTDEIAALDSQINTLQRQAG